MPAPKKPAPLSQSELQTQILGAGDAFALQNVFCSAVDRKLDEVERVSSQRVREPLTNQLAVQFIHEGKIVEPDGEVIGIVRRNIDEAIKSGIITTTEEGRNYVGIYTKMVTNRLEEIIENKEKYKKDPGLVGEVLEKR